MVLSRKNNQKTLAGFTLIELLVVIAIIGLLVTIVMVLVNSVRSKAADTTVKANLKTIMTQAEFIYDNVSPNSYATACSDPTVLKAMASVIATGGGTAGASPYTCNNVLQDCCTSSAGTAWVAIAKLKSAATIWCVDSSGNSRATTGNAVINAGATVCP